jgi:hypothetical protein
VCGCGKQPSPSKLNFTEIGFVEEHSPTPVGFVLQNPGASPVQLDNVLFQLEDHQALTPAMNSPVKSMTMKTFLLEEEPHDNGSFSPLAKGNHIAIKPGASGLVKCMLQWSSVKGDEAPIIAVLRGTFVVRNQEEQLARSEPVLFVLQSREGAIDAVLDAPDGTWKSAADRLYMLSLNVEQSPMAAKLIRAYQERGYIPRDRCRSCRGKTKRFVRSAILAAQRGAFDAIARVA